MRLAVDGTPEEVRKTEAFRSGVAASFQNAALKHLEVRLTYAMQLFEEVRQLNIYVCKHICRYVYRLSLSISLYHSIHLPIYLSFYTSPFKTRRSNNSRSYAMQLFEEVRDVYKYIYIYILTFTYTYTYLCSGTSKCDSPTPCNFLRRCDIYICMQTCM